MKVTKRVSPTKAKAKILNPSFFANGRESYGIKSCVITENNFQEAINVARVVHDGIEIEYIRANGCVITKRWGGQYTFNVDSHKVSIIADEQNDSAAFFVKCETSVIGGYCYDELIFALWRKDEASFYFQLITNSSSSPDGPYRSLVLCGLENRTLCYNQNSEQAYEAILGGNGSIRKKQV
jgi:hypothetical protein